MSGLQFGKLKRLFENGSPMADWRGGFAGLVGFWTYRPLTPVVCQRAGDSTAVASGRIERTCCGEEDRLVREGRAEHHADAPGVAHDDRADLQELGT